MLRPSEKIRSIVLSNWKVQYDPDNKQPLTDDQIFEAINSDNVIKAIVQYLDGQFNAMTKVAEILESPFLKDSGKLKMLRSLVAVFGEGESLHKESISPKNFQKHLKDSETEEL